MYDAIKRLYAKTNDTRIVQAAVRKGWITAEQYTSITEEEYNELVALMS